MSVASIQTQTLDFIPDCLALHAQNPSRYPHLLASTATSAAVDNHLARYSILFAFPQNTFYAEDFFERLDRQWQAEACDPIVSDLPFTGGWFLYLGYEMAQDIEQGLELPAAEDGLPRAFASRFPAAIIIDHQQHSAHLMCETEHAAYLDKMVADIEALDASHVLYQQAVTIEDLQEDDEAAYRQQLARLKQYIVDGDVFQVNLSRGWHTRLIGNTSHASLFWHLSQHNPGPFNALVTLGDQAIISSSPERLIEARHGQVQTRPIAGTRPRSVNEREDQALSSELLGHPKERAEHIMLIDLERNDLGRICQPGSVEVNELMVLETYQHVHHIVSNVRGRLKADVTPSAVIRAVFPGGTITGCPKVRCMEILAELEQTGRGAYTGSLGYLNRDGSMDLNILIRTMVRNGDELRFRAGGGIVVDSDPIHELNETRAKAKGMIMALKGRP